jgi:predicted DNA-binding WGR domain protein
MLLHRRNPAKRMFRFYRLRFQPILWGGTALVREWGSIGSPGRVKNDHHPDDQAATVAAARLERSKRRRGYV